MRQAIKMEDIQGEGAPLLKKSTNPKLDSLLHTISLIEQFKLNEAPNLVIDIISAIRAKHLNVACKTCCWRSPKSDCDVAIYQLKNSMKLIIKTLDKVDGQLARALFALETALDARSNLTPEYHNALTLIFEKIKKSQTLESRNIYKEEKPDTDVSEHGRGVGL